MPTRLSRAAYEKLIVEDVEALLRATTIPLLEREHAILVLRESVERLYGPEVVASVFVYDRDGAEVETRVVATINVRRTVGGDVDVEVVAYGLSLRLRGNPFLVGIEVERRLRELGVAPSMVARAGEDVARYLVEDVS